MSTSGNTNGFDQEILKDFLTESGELLEQLEADLVVLESTPQDLDLLNRVFRALHTIKGSASFLALTNLVAVAHAAEGALNCARNGQVVVDAPMMNLLLEAADVIKNHLAQIASGEDLAAPRAALVSGLSAYAGVHAPSHAQTTTAPPAITPTRAQASDDHVPTTRALTLSPGKEDLYEFLVADLDETLAKVSTLVGQLASNAGDTPAPLAEHCEQLARCVEFFECEQMSDLARTLGDASAKVTPANASAVASAFQQVVALLGMQAGGIKAREVREVAAHDALAAIEQALAGVRSAGPTPTLPQHVNGGAATALVAEPAATSTIATTPAAKPREESEKKPAAGDSTIRVEVGRLEALMNLVGELVLQKNRVFALSRRLTSESVAGARTSTVEGKGASQFAADLSEAMAMAAGSLDRVTSDIQVAVMRTRMQPVDKLFGRYPRLIRDLAAKTGKKINLVIEGGETEVDKSVIEELGDPLVHMLRNSCDHGLEPPAERTQAGKSETGTITIRASHEGSHVRIVIADDGRGLHRDRIGKKAVERGLLTPEALTAMSDHEVYQLIFEPGFSTAEQVSDLSGRGVGMDVVRTNIQKLKGAIALASTPGKGTSLTITIPLTVAILHAMMVAVGEEIYAVPLSGILEIVRPADMHTSSIGGHSVMRLRDSLLPLVSGASLFEHPSQAEIQTPFAVVLQMGDKRVGLLVTRLIGQQEVVVKPLDDSLAHGRRAVSGATVRDDGGVSLIVDIAELVKMAQTHAQAA